MYKRNPQKADGAILYGSIPEAATRYGLGRTLLKAKAVETGALLRVGRRVLVDYEKMDAYFKTLAAGQR